ncbi:hypothetical protein [Streptosporangium sp. CA-115845]|uniref:hypothetical protein n=1 Tax=Streptosporangium sp. CA-115845 TaxID=3240071 RepID=UPI003D9291F1
MKIGEDVGDDLTPEEALRQIGEVDRRTRRPARVAGLLYAALGLATIAPPFYAAWRVLRAER